MEMSAPESGNAVTTASPLRADMCAVMVGAGSICCVEARYAWGWVVGGACCWHRLRQTRAKWPSLLQLRQVTLNAGHRCLPPWWCGDPHPGHVPVSGVVGLLGGGVADSLDGRVAKWCASDFCTLLFGCLLCTAFGYGSF